MSDLEQKILKSHPPEAFLEEKFHSLGFEQLTDIQKKAMKYGEKDANFKIRNRASGFVYIREDIEPPLEVEEVALKAFKAFSLHFGAVDVIWTENTKKALVLEINTAPGLEGQTVVSYAEAIKEYL